MTQEWETQERKIDEARVDVVMKHYARYGAVTPGQVRTVIATAKTVDPTEVGRIYRSVSVPQAAQALFGSRERYDEVYILLRYLGLGLKRPGMTRNKPAAAARRRTLLDGRAAVAWAASLR